MNETKKYIIEFSEDPHTIRLLKLKNGDKYPVTEFKTITPYTEPDLEQVRKEAYSNGYGTAKRECEDCTKPLDNGKAYQQGLTDAWEAARWLAKNNAGVNFKVFGMHFTTEIFQNISASECIEKIRQYEQKEKEEQEQFVTAEEVMRQYLDTFCKGKSCTGCPLHTPDFTCGRGYNFLTNKQVSDEEVRKAYAAVLAKMKE